MSSLFPASCGPAWTLFYSDSNQPPLETGTVLFAKGGLQPPQLPGLLRTSKSQVAVVWSPAPIINLHPEAFDCLRGELKHSLSERPLAAPPHCQALTPGLWQTAFLDLPFSSLFSLPQPLISPLLEHSHFYFQPTVFNSWGSSEKTLKDFAIYQCASPLELGVLRRWDNRFQSWAPTLLSERNCLHSSSCSKKQQVQKAKATLEPFGPKNTAQCNKSTHRLGTPALFCLRDGPGIRPQPRSLRLPFQVVPPTPSLNRDERQLGRASHEEMGRVQFIFTRC